jgi:hypothetical protein
MLQRACACLAVSGWWSRRQKLFQSVWFQGLVLPALFDVLQRLVCVSQYGVVLSCQEGGLAGARWPPRPRQSGLLGMFQHMLPAPVQQLCHSSAS